MYHKSGATLLSAASHKMPNSGRSAFLENFPPVKKFLSVEQFRFSAARFLGEQKKKKKEGKEYESSHRRANARNESLEGAKKRSKCQAFGSRFSGWLARARFVQGKRVYTLAHTDRGHAHTGDIGRTWSGWFVETGCKL